MEVHSECNKFPLCTEFFLSAADCQSSGITDCTVCGDRVGCHTQYNCNCHSRCYEFGDCCPDVSTLKNCVGECKICTINWLWYSVPQVILFNNNIMENGHKLGKKR